MKEQIIGFSNKSKSSLLELEKKIIHKIIPLIPKSIKSYHLTNMTIFFSIAIIISSYLSLKNINWLWLNSVIIILHYITDSLDGSLGIYRKEGLIRWGYYLDHFLDYIFVSTIIIGYFIIFYNTNYYNLLAIMCLFFVSVGFMIHLFLSFPIINELKVYFPNPLFSFIFVNIAIIFFGKENSSLILFIILGISILLLIFFVYKFQKFAKSVDKKVKQKNQD